MRRMQSRPWPKAEDATHQIEEKESDGNESNTEFTTIKEEVPSEREVEEIRRMTL